LLLQSLGCKFSFFIFKIFYLFQGVLYVDANWQNERILECLRYKKLFCTVYGLEPNPNQPIYSDYRFIHYTRVFCAFNINLSISIFFSIYYDYYLINWNQNEIFNISVNLTSLKRQTTFWKCQDWGILWL